jgi:hypothetical protein
MTLPSQFQKMRINRERARLAAAATAQDADLRDQSMCRANQQLLDSGQEPRYCDASNYEELRLLWTLNQER